METRTALSPIYSLVVTPTPIEHAVGAKVVAERVSERQMARFLAAIIDPQNLAYFHADALIALIPTGDPEAASASLLAARRARRRQRQVQFLFTADREAIATMPAKEFVLDLREATWGATPQRRLGGWTAAELRAILGSIIADEQIWGPRTDGNEDVVVLNGRRIYLLDEADDGLFTCVAPA